MRVVCALNIITGTWTLSNAFSAQTVTEAWIATQPKPEEYIPVGLDIPDAQWRVVKAKLDHVTNNAALAHQLNTVQVAKFGETKQEVKRVVPKLPAAPKLTLQEVESIYAEVVGLNSAVLSMQDNLKAWQEAPASSQRESAIKALAQEIKLGEERLAYLDAQTVGLRPADVVEDTKESGEATPPVPPVPPETSTATPSLADKLAALKTNK